VRVKTAFETFEGEIFSFDTSSQCVVLQQSTLHSTLKKTYRILKVPLIKEVQILSGKDAAKSDLALPAVNISKIRQKYCVCEIAGFRRKFSSSHKARLKC